MLTTQPHLKFPTYLHVWKRLSANQSLVCKSLKQTQRPLKRTKSAKAPRRAAGLILDLLHRDKATCPRGPPRGWRPKSPATCQILWLTFLPRTHLAALSTGGCRETGGPQTELLEGTLTVSFIAANNETGERRSWTCEFPPLSPSRSTPSSLRQREEKDCVCVWEIKNTETEKKTDSVEVSDTERKSLLVVVIWSRFFGKGTYAFLLFFFKKREIFFPLFPRTPGLENPVKATAVVSFSPNKGQGPTGSWYAIQGRL